MPFSSPNGRIWQPNFSRKTGNGHETEREMTFSLFSCLVEAERTLGVPWTAPKPNPRCSASGRGSFARKCRAT